MRNDFHSGYLIHHGILGQKWGVKNGPPYPLDQSDKSSSEKSLDKRLILSDNQKKILKTIVKTAGIVGIGMKRFLRQQRIL